MCLVPTQDSDSPLAALRKAPDHVLVEGCLSGNPACQRELFRRERPRLRARLVRLLGPGTEIDDLVQDILFAVFRGLDRFRGDASLATWIDAFALRASFLHIRKQRRRLALNAISDDDVSPAPGPDRVATARETARRVQRILRKMGVPHRDTFTLHVIEGRPLAEVARLTDVTLPAVKARLIRARRQVERHAKRDPILAEYLTRDGRLASQE